MIYENLSKEQLKNEYLTLKKEYENFKKLNLDLDMSRGKPCAEQLNLSLNMLKDVDINCFTKTKQGQDPRNYGLLSGTLEAKQFFSNILNVPTDRIIVGDGSSLSLMFDYINMAVNFGLLGSTPWNKLKEVKFLCPCPGYDRHFAICELFNIKMINININQNGPDITQIKELVEENPSIKGIWCVPKYSNPTGITYKNEIVTAFAKLRPAAEDFRIFWDNAYAIHHLTEKHDELLNIFEECEKYNTQNMVVEFTSTAKITFAGSGISAIAASEENIKDILNIMSKRIICFNKINQIRHAKFFNTIEKLEKHMQNHAKIIKPKFDLILNKFEKELKPLKIASWSCPNGGYFISFNAFNGCAKRIYKLCKDAGVTLTNPGATYPYSKDPNDSNIRIAPTYPSIEDLKTASNIFCICVKIATIEKLL